MKRWRIEREPSRGALSDIARANPLTDGGVPVFHVPLHGGYARAVPARALGWQEHGAVRRFLVVEGARERYGAWRWYALDRVTGYRWSCERRREAKRMARDLGKRFGAWINIGRVA